MSIARAQELEHAPLIPGEDSSSIRPEDALTWALVYSEMIRFKRRLIEDSGETILSGRIGTGERSATDLRLLEQDLSRLEVGRLFWQRRHWELVGLGLDPEGLLLRHGAAVAPLSRREYELLEVLMAENGRPLPARDLLARGWGGEQSGEQLRNYITRIRRKLVVVGAPCSLINDPRRGYWLLFA